MKLTLKPGRRLRHYVARHSSAGWNPVKNKKILFVYGLVFLPLLAIGGSSYALFLSGGNGPAASINSVNLQKGLVGWWQMNGNAKDSTPYGNNLTPVNTVALTTDRKGLANGAYNFSADGSSYSYLKSGSLAASSPLATLTAGSITAWIHPTDTGGTQVIGRVGTGSNERISLSFDGSNKRLYIEVYSGGSWPKVYSASNVVPLNQWSHVAVTVTPSSSVTFYVNGTAAGTGNESAPTAPAADIAIGALPYAAQYIGSIGDVRIYNRALSAAEVTALYNEYDPGVKAASGENGLVGWWKLNGNAKDSSPYGNNGIVNGTTSTTGPNGQLNDAMSFNGTASDYISVNGVNPMIMGGGSYFSSSWTLSIWTKGANPSGSGLLLGRKGDNTGILQQGNNYDFVLWQAAGQEKSIVYTESNFSAWHLLTAVYSDGNMSFYVDGNLVGTNTLTAIQTLYDPIYIGGYGASTWSGQTSLSDARTYNRALSSSEVSNLYNSYNSQVSVSNLQSGLVGDWAFNGNAKDSTPYSDNGIVNGATLTTDRKGRANSAYRFSGSSVINTPTLSQLNRGTITIAGWVYLNSRTSTRQTVVSIGENTSTGSVLAADDGGGNICFWIHNSTGWHFVTTPSNIGQWEFLTGTYDGTTLSLYVNGVLKYSNAPGGGVMDTPTDNTGFGARDSDTGHWFGGSIDDVRIWNRALSAAEVQALYQEYN